MKRRRGDAAYVMLAGDSKVYSVPKNTKANLDKGLKDLRDKRLMPVDFDKIFEAWKSSGSEVASDLRFRPTGSGPFAALLNLRGDTSKMETIVEKLRTSTMDPSTSDADMEEDGFHVCLGSSPVANSIKATDASGSQELQIRKAIGGYYAKTSAMDGVYKVPNELGDAVNKDAEDFREKRVFDFGGGRSRAKVELHDFDRRPISRRAAARTLVEGRQEDGCAERPGFPALDSHAHGGEICDASGFSSPAISPVVTSKDGKRVEKVDMVEGRKRVPGETSRRVRRCLRTGCAKAHRRNCRKPRAN